MVNAGKLPNTKCNCESFLPQVERALHLWFCEMRSKPHTPPLNQALLIQKATQQVFSTFPTCIYLSINTCNKYFDHFDICLITLLYYTFSFAKQFGYPDWQCYGSFIHWRTKRYSMVNKTICGSKQYAAPSPYWLVLLHGNLFLFLPGREAVGHPACPGALGIRASSPRPPPPPSTQNWENIPSLVLHIYVLSKYMSW